MTQTHLQGEIAHQEKEIRHWKGQIETGYSIPYIL